MFSYEVAVQGPSSQNAVINAIRAGAATAAFNRLRGAYAYATAGGAYELARVLASVTPDWEGMDKRWLVSLDFGHTEPEGLEYLASLGNSLVRVPNASEVIANNLLPARCFHPKTLVLDTGGRAARPPLMVVVGSANMTVSGLRTGYEDVSVAAWTIGRLTVGGRAQLAAAQRQAARMDAVWRTARRLDAKLMRDYALARARRRPQSEDATARVRRLEQDLVFPYPKLALVAGARSLWIEIRRVNQNLGPGRPGNQIEFQHGTRVYFGLVQRRVPPNTALGSVDIRYRGIRRLKNMRFGDNMMDKLDLPIPGTEGPTTYENSVLRFNRVPDGSYELRVGSPADINRWRNESMAAGTLFKLTSGREWGVLS